MFTESIKLNVLLIALFTVVAFALPVFVAHDGQFDTAVADAFGGGPGGGGGSGGDGEGGACGGCSSTPTPTPTPTPEPPKCEDPAATNTGGNLPCTYPIPDPTPTCDAFAANPTTIVRGQSTLLTWASTNATAASINNAIGAVAVDGTRNVSPIANTTYTLTLTAPGQPNVTCNAPVVVTNPTTPTTPAIDIIKRDAVDKDDTQTVSVGGTAQFEIVVTNTGNENLVSVVVTDPLEPACNKTIGALAIGASDTYTCNSTNVTAAFTNVANVTGNSAVDNQVVTDTDPTQVLIPAANVFTCGNNVSFSASASAISSGGSSTLNWSTTNVDSLTISGINATSLSGNQTVSPSSDTTYTLNATQGGTTIACPLTVTVSTGGGGGSPSPRCELEISETRITSGEEVTITWDTRSATEVTLKDDRGRVLFTTEGKLSSDKREFFDYSFEVTPTRNTTYTLVAERGSKDRECEVEVEIDGDEVVLLQVRDQSPLVSGISLTQVPYTGFEAGPVMTVLFYMLLIGWALYITYVLVIPRTQLAVVTVAPIKSNVKSNSDLMTDAEKVRPDVFSTMQAPVAAVPTNLPVAPVLPVVAETEDTNSIENQAHALQALISSDAVRTIATMTNDDNQSSVVAQIVADAKGVFPLEDGWVVINRSRLMEIVDVAPVAVSSAPTGAGSLAEAIVTGNVVAAYDLIGARPMIALADAAADLDALYRIRKGADATVSDMLQNESANLTDGQVTGMIEALTGALDGMYSDEASAVKMAIMKAVKAAA